MQLEAESGSNHLRAYDVCRRLRALPWGGALRIVAVTGFGQEEDRKRTATAGFDAHVVKPAAPGAWAALFASLTDGGERRRLDS